MCNYFFSKYAWVVPLKDKRGISIVNVFENIISEGRKPIKIWVDDQGSEFYKDLFMYSTYNDRKSIVAERFIKTLKTKTFKHMTAV